MPRRLNALTLLRWMIREEWRTHTRLFGGRSFALFPLLVLALSAGSFRLLGGAGIGTGELLSGTGVLLLFLGLNVGTIGFVSRDVLKNLLGEFNLLMFSARTLPVSWHRIVFVFVLKDFIYYIGMFVVPAVLATLVVVPVARLPAVLAAYSLVFAAGVSTSFMLAVMYDRSRLLCGLAMAGFVALFWYFNVGLFAFTGLALLRAPSLANVAFAAVPIAVMTVTGVALFRPEGGHGKRRREPLYGRVRDRLPGSSALVAKTVIDMLRSSGGLWKLVVSQVLVFGVFFIAIDRVPFLAAAVRNPGIAFGAIGALSAVTVYNWVNRFDDRSGYLLLPLTPRDLMVGKQRAFLLLAYPFSVLMVLLASGALVQAVVAAVVLCSSMVYLLGAVSLFGGFDPNTRLMDARIFAVFSAVILVPMVPLLVLSMWPGQQLVVMAVAGVIGLVSIGPGVAMMRRAREKWSG